MSERQFKEGRVITVNEVSDATGISRITLSRIINQRGYNTGTENVDRLCRYFGCQAGEVIEYVEDEQK